jgi:hypothetical protein
METFVFPRSAWFSSVLVAALLLFIPAPARAAAPLESVPDVAAGAVFAEGSFTSYFTQSTGRDRVVQVCVLCMALALFILMKKFAPEADGWKKRRTGTSPARSGEECSRAARSVTPDSSPKV